MKTIHMFQTTPRIIMGPGAVAGIVDEVRRFAAQKVLIVTDPGIVKAGIIDKVESILSKAGVVFSRFQDIEPDPRLEIAEAAAQFARHEGVDLIIGVGGGSSIDIAKITAILVTNDQKLSSLVGIDLIPLPGLKTIIIPTTAGTGSEVTPIVILSDEDEQLKKGVVSPYLFPNTAILDPELTAGMPPAVTAATGMDALIHAIEAYTSKNAWPMTDMLALEAIKKIHKNLRAACTNGSDLAARAAMLEGSMLAGMAFANAGVTAVHAFAYPIGATFHIPHGVANSIMLIPVMEFNMSANLEKFADIAACLGVDTKGLGLQEACLKGIAAVRSLAEDVNVPSRLLPFGIEKADIPALAEGVLKVTRLLANNPRDLSKQDAERIYLSVL
ncbi:MAG: iron-containing alcohol dehydrogenase [Deltaproteobacteria bacterium]|nr:iron-containing alcohol dehydrogenase [Candidatus Anaeroferrophillus wilburensis]MBN2889014.1 iron-containing alcohol dehydrogenase [Deltaproteobacteria bacterium]